ncbi:hypothetical protein ACKWB9_12475 [Maribacter sp. 2304DJ31-5]
MKNKYNILFLFAILLIGSCKQKDKEIEANHISDSIEKIKISPNYKWLVILPGLGCHGCIQEGEAFMQEYVDNKDILFVLTKIESLKILQKKININIKEHNNIYIDRGRLFDLPTDNAIYPCIVELNEGKLRSHGFQSPVSSDAFEKLKARI